MGEFKFDRQSADPARFDYAFSDGAASGNPGPGGWGSLLYLGEQVVELAGGEPHTTNNRMELLGAMEAIRIHQESESSRSLLVFSDSKYVIQGSTSWLQGWKRGGWKTKSGGDVLNQDLWKQMDRLLGRARISEWVYVPGHSGVGGNERVDKLAQGVSQGSPLHLYSGPLSDYSMSLDEALTQSASGLAAGSAKKKSRKGKALYYLSFVGGALEKHQTWGECSSRVDGRSGAKYRKVLSESEVTEILDDWRVPLSERNKI